MIRVGKPTCLYIDKKTKGLLDKFGEQHQLSRSASLRLIINKFFIDQKKVGRDH